MYAPTPKCGRRHRRGNQWGWCSISRPRTRTGQFLPACMAHLTQQERADLGMLPGAAPRQRTEMVDVAKVRAGDRD